MNETATATTAAPPRPLQAAVRGTIVNVGDARNLEGGYVVQEIDLEVKTFREEKTRIPVKLWGDHVEAFAKLDLKRGNRIEVEGEPSREDWDSKAEPGKQDSKIGVVVDKESHLVQPASAPEDHNYVRLEGGVVKWAGEMQKVPRKSNPSETTGFRELSVAVPIVGAKGNAAELPFHVRTIGHEKVVEPLAAGSQVPVVEGRIENRDWVPEGAPKTEGGKDRKRYRGEIVVAFGDDGGSIESAAA